jgi:hypothetical protein
MLQLRAKALAPLPLLAVLVSLSACQVDPPYVHERFAELRPARVAVTPVVNRTLRDLRQVSTAALLQRVTLGAGAVDVLAVLDEALREGLAARGYEVEEAGASRPSAGEGGGGRAVAAGASDAVLECEVNDFSASSASTGGTLEIAGEVALVRIAGSGTREVIFGRKFRHWSGRGSSGPRTAAEFEAEIRRVGMGILDGLPPRTPAAAPAGGAR